MIAAVRRWSGQRIVLDALGAAGPAGMTTMSLEVSTRLTEPLLHASLARLLQAGLICRRRGGRPSLHPLNAERYLLVVYGGQRPAS